MAIRIKICGITRRDDALVAAEAGADALGFMFYPPSPRAVTPPQAAAIIKALPPFIHAVGVFVNPTRDEVEAALAAGIGTLQFHGEESPEFCASFGATKVIKAFRVRDAASLDVLPRYPTDAWLLDSFVAGKLGGTGHAFNWDLVHTAKASGRPVILAGGLTPENAADAVRQVAPYGLDVSSGVESAPGCKDPARVRAFIAAARSV